MEERIEELPAHSSWWIGGVGLFFFACAAIEIMKWDSLGLRALVLAILATGWFSLVRYLADQPRERVVLRDGMLIFELRKFTERFAVEDIVLIRPQPDKPAGYDAECELLEIVFQDKSIQKLPMRVGLGFALHKLLKGKVNVIDWELTRNS